MLVIGRSKSFALLNKIVVGAVSVSAAYALRQAKPKSCLSYFFKVRDFIIFTASFIPMGIFIYSFSFDLECYFQT